MKKVTKKELVEKANDHELRLFQIEKALQQHGINWFVEEPKLKQLDQSSFKEWADCWKFFAFDKNGEAWRYREEPKIDDGDTRWSSSNTVPMKIGEGYDASNWQNSLIERDLAKELLEVDLSSELTGSDLCRKMLERGDKVVLCAVGTPESVSGGSYYRAITEWSVANKSFTDDSRELHLKDVTPINNQGEPLTASEVGL